MKVHLVNLTNETAVTIGDTVTPILTVDITIRNRHFAVVTLKVFRTLHFTCYTFGLGKKSANLANIVWPFLDFTLGAILTGIIRASVNQRLAVLAAIVVCTLKIAALWFLMRQSIMNYRLNSLCSYSPCRQRHTRRRFDTDYSRTC